MSERIPRRVLAFMAHPDDAEILAGGTLLRLQSLGWEIGIATMTAGDCGASGGSCEEIAAVRLEEAAAAAALLGGTHSCAGLGDNRVFASADNVGLAVERIRSFAPSVVITHSPVDYMVDHEESSRMVRAAAFAAAMPLYRTAAPDPVPHTAATPALYYADAVEGVDPFGRPVEPAFCVDVGDVIDRKAELLACHASQREWLRRHHGMDEYILMMRTWAAGRGSSCGCAFAEGFRQHLGHGYPRDPVLQTALAPYLRYPVTGSA